MAVAPRRPPPRVVAATASPTPFAGACFDPACAAAADAAFAAAIAVPLTAAAALAAWWVLRRPPRELVESGRVFEDEETGTLFEVPGDAAEATAAERDKNGRLAFKVPGGYTPWPVDESAPGERVRINVGRVGMTQPRTYVFERKLGGGGGTGGSSSSSGGGGSEIVVVTLPRPLGIIFEWDQSRRRSFVAGFVPGGNAEQLRKRAGLGPDKSSAVCEGDILRAVTVTTPVWPTKALLGAVPPERHIVLYGADRTKWAELKIALRRGEVKDGPVTMVLERRRV